MNSPFANLPTELLLIIFSFVGSDDIFTLLWVCRQWRSVCGILTVENIEWDNS